MTDYTKWYVGMKVVFIVKNNGRNSNHGGYGNETDPVFGKIYTIRDLGIDELYGPTLRLVEIVNPIQEYRTAAGIIINEEVWFVCSNFRPVEERKTDISIFKKLIQDDQVKIKEKL